MANTENETKPTIQTDFVSVYQDILKRYNEEHAKLTKMLAEIENMKKNMPVPDKSPEEMAEIQGRVDKFVAEVFKANGLPETLAEVEMLPQKMLINASLQVKRKAQDAQTKQNKETKEIKKQLRKV